MHAVLRGLHAAPTATRRAMGASSFSFSRAFSRSTGSSAAGPRRAPWALAAGAAAAVAAGAVCSCVEADRSNSVEGGQKHAAPSAAPAADVPSGSVDKLDALRPKDKDFIRIDEKVLEQMSDFASGHALHEALKGDSLVETFELYVNPKTQRAHAVLHFGAKLNGHPTVVHGGILALAFDETFGWLLHFGLKSTQAFTANLSVNYR
jgi:hypothetical protein